MLSRRCLAVALVILAGCAPPRPPAPERLPQVPSIAKVDRTQDPQLKEAMAKAQSTLDSFIQRLDNPQHAETFSVEGRFAAEDGSPVYLWLSDVAYKNGKFTGTVTTHPKIAVSVEYGKPATVDRKDVSDWMILKSGRSEGGFTIEILMQREAAPR